MATETIVWTALPFGVVKHGGVRYVRISAFASPRLRATEAEGDTLSLYPIVRHWTQNVRDSLRGFEVHAGGQTLHARLTSRKPLDPDWWEGLFNDDTYVQPYAYNDYTDRLIISYPVRRVLGHLKNVYQQIGLESPGNLPVLRGRDPAGSGIPGFQQGYIPFDKEVAQRLRAELSDTVTGTVFTGSPDSGFNAVSGDPVRDMQQLMLFHYPPQKLTTTLDEDKAAVTTPPPPLPSTEADFERYMDFHQVISSLGDYPVLLRRLGLVIDILVPADDVPPNTQIIYITPVWRNPQIGSRLNAELPRTAVVWNMNSGTFLARSQPNALPRIARGMLVLDAQDDGFDLVEVDVDGAAIKLVNMINNMSGAASANLLAVDSPNQLGLPSMRSAGFSLNLDGRDIVTYTHFDDTKSNNDDLEAGHDYDILLHAEDLLRGYRVDIWDSMTQAWHSLCLREGDYSVEGTALLLEDQLDEGFAQMAMTQAAPTEEGTDAATDDLYLHELLFRWEGWSLVAPRPGKTIGEQGDTNSPTVDPQPQPMMPFKLIANFTVARRSLPRLRFGAGYRMRVRVADLAGNSVSLDDASDALALPLPTVTPEIYYRYEPLGPPSIFLREAITADSPGESVAHMVICSFNSAPALDHTPVSDTNERHIAAPPTSQLMAEIHGVFDDVTGHLKNDPATYNLIASRDSAVDLTQTSTPVIPDAQMEIGYLPDALAMGAALRDLPGTEEGTWGKVDVTGQLVYNPVPGIQVRPGTVTHVPYLGAGGATYPAGLQALYTFEEGGGNVVHDVSDVGDPVDLTISDPGNVTWGSDSAHPEQRDHYSQRQPAHGPYERAAGQQRDHGRMLDLTGRSGAD